MAQKKPIAISVIAPVAMAGILIMAILAAILSTNQAIAYGSYKSPATAKEAQKPVPELNCKGPAGMKNEIGSIHLHLHNGKCEVKPF